MAACPNCGNTMEHGFSGSESLISGAKWFTRTSKLGTGGEALVKPGGLGIVYIERERCTGCKLLLLRY
ncbi:MAG: PF20097 family protein [Candidatus Geothermarchaeales archaeon]